MNYIDNLRGAFQTKLDALNNMDHFSQIARAAKGTRPSAHSTPTPTPVGSGVKPGLGALLFGAVVAVVGAIVLGNSDKTIK